MTLEELTATMQEQESLASINFEDVAPNVRTGMAARAAMAKEDLKKLKKEHKDLIVKNVLTIFPVGSKTNVDKLVVSAKEASGAFVIDVNDYYRSITVPVWGANASKNPGNINFTQVAIASSKFMDSVMNLGYNTFNKLNFDEMPHVNNEEETSQYVKKVVRQANADTFSVAYMVNTLSDLVYSSKFTKTTVPVVVVGTTTEEAQSIASALQAMGAQAQRVDNVFTLTDLELDNETIMKMLGMVKKKVSNKKEAPLKENQ